MSFIVYKHTSPSNKVYIGITKQNPIKRWRGGKGYINNTYFFRAILKYGWNNFQHEILYSELSEKEAKQIEIYLISYYNSTDHNYGYNKTKGGDYRCKMSEEAKQQMIQKLTGRKRTDETKHKISVSKKGNCPKSLSEKHKSNISKSLIGNKRAAGLKTNMKPVIQFDSNWNFICFWESAVNAGNYLHCSSSGINAACKENIQKDVLTTKYKGRYKGFKWLYLDDYERWANKLGGVPKRY